MDTSDESNTYVQRAQEEIIPVLRSLKLRFDTRAYVAILAHEVAHTYQDLKAAGVENEMSLKRIFRFLEKIAQENPERAPRVLNEVPDGPETVN